MRCEIFATEMKQNPESSSQSRSGQEIIKAGAEGGKMNCIFVSDVQTANTLSIVNCLYYSV